MKRTIIDASNLELTEKVVSIKRVTKVVKGGRNFRFSCLVIVGDENGHVGVGKGKAMEIPDAIRNGIDAAKKSLIKVPMVGTTIPHAINGESGAGHVLLKPAGEGTGVIAGGAMRAVLEVAGVQNVLAKCYGSTNAANVVQATFKGLRDMTSPEQVAAKRGKSVEEILG